MSSVDIFKWTFSPTGYFEQPIEIIRGDYAILVTEGRAEARFDSEIYDATPSIRDELHSALNDRFRAAQIVLFRPYQLLNPVRTRLHSDGSKDVFIEAITGGLVYSTYPADIRRTLPDGTVVYDSKQERIDNIKNLGDLIAESNSKDPTRFRILNGFSAAVNDPGNELVYLYEIRDALSKKFRGKSKALKVLAIPDKKWNRLGALCDIEPLFQGRHRGQMGFNLRNATPDELKEVRDIARLMVQQYLEFLTAKQKMDR